MFVTLLFVGCEEPQQKVWGKGELNPEYQEFFGNSNGARLDYVQNQLLDKHSKAFKEVLMRLIALEAVDPNE